MSGETGCGGRQVKHCVKVENQKDAEAVGILRSFDLAPMLPRGAAIS
jgi:hypothetical protein